MLTGNMYRLCLQKLFYGHYNNKDQSTSELTGGFKRMRRRNQNTRIF